MFHSELGTRQEPLAGRLAIKKAAGMLSISVRFLTNRQKELSYGYQYKHTIRVCFAGAF
jgi:hypothetical protein